MRHGNLDRANICKQLYVHTLALKRQNIVIFISQDTIIRNIKNAERCTDVIGSELKAQYKFAKKYEEKVAPLDDRMHEIKAGMNNTIQKIQGEFWL